MLGVSWSRQKNGLRISTETLEVLRHLKGTAFLYPIKNSILKPSQSLCT